MIFAKVPIFLMQGTHNSYEPRHTYAMFIVMPSSDFYEAVS